MDARNSDFYALEGLSVARCEVDCVLKESLYERTEIVMLVSLDGTRKGPFVRKTINRSLGLGSAYDLVFSAQNEGLNFLHLPRIESCEQRDDELVVIMEKIPGVTLDLKVKSVRESCSRAEYEDWIRQTFLEICDGVLEMHELFDPPIIHRDLKPENIVCSPELVSIIDFGIARPFRSGAMTDTVKFGTRAYAPPEQFGYGQTDARSDVYALGMVLYFMLKGEDPSPRLVEEEFSREGFNEAILGVLRKATAFSPKERFADVRDLKEAFLFATRPSVEAIWGGFELAGEGGSVSPAQERQDVLTFGERLGLAWNALVGSATALLLVMCFLAVLDPTEYDLQFPLWFRVLEYIGFLAVGFVGVAFILFDKRFLSRRFSRFSGRAWKSYLPTGIKILFFSLACIVLATFIYAFAFADALPVEAFG